MRSGILVLVTVLALLPLSAALDPSDAPTFRLSETGATGPELNLGVTSTGVLFVGGWGPLARSFDDGLTWDNPSITGSVLSADRVLIVDKDTDRVFVDDTTLGCTLLAWSDDLGETWLTNPLACGGGVTDHQKIAVGKPITLGATPLYPNLVYVCANGLSHANCGVSNDGGLTFITTAPHGIGCAFQGAPVTAPDGTLYEPTSQCGLKVRRNLQNGLATWQEYVVTTSTSSDAPDVATTDDGTVYVVHTSDAWQPQFWRSTDKGAHWTGPYAIPVPGLASAVFPVVVGGEPGRVAFSFYGTTDAPAGWDRNPGTAPDTVRWQGYVAVVTDAAGAAPTVAPVQVTTQPLQYGCLSKLGGCLNNIADYMDIDVGPDGRVYAVYTDGCPASCDSVSESTADDALVAVQTGGADLRS